MSNETDKTILNGTNKRQEVMLRLKKKKEENE